MSEESVSNRRSFLKKTAIAGAGTAAGLAGVNFLSPAVLKEEMVFEPNTSHWAKLLPPTTAGLSHDIETDWAIIGGGFTGLSAAYYLKKGGLQDRVVVVEAAKCGNGASGRNGAMVLTSTADRFLKLSADPALDKRIYELTAANVQQIANIAEELGFDTHLDRNGALQVCNTEEQAEDSRKYAESAKAMGIPVEYWDRARVREAIGTEVYPGGVFDPASGHVHPGRLVGMWRAAAESVGVEVIEGTPIVQVEEGEKLTLHAANGHTIRAKGLVLAANAFTSKLGYLRRVAAPIFEYVGITPALTDEQVSAVRWKSRIPFNDMRTEVYYLGITRENQVHIGGGPVSYSFNNGVGAAANTGEHFEILREELGRIFPSLRGVPFETTWTGVVDMTLDESPAVGRIPDTENVYYALGFSGHGVNLTSVFGRILADVARGKEKEWSWFPYWNRMPPYTPNEPFRWAGVKLALGYYRTTDPKRP